MAFLDMGWRPLELGWGAPGPCWGPLNVDVQYQLEAALVVGAGRDILGFVVQSGRNRALGTRKTHVDSLVD